MAEIEKDLLGPGKHSNKYKKRKKQLIIFIRINNCSGKFLLVISLKGTGCPRTKKSGIFQIFRDDFGTLECWPAR
jgi:hypothetical protein